MYVRVPDRLPGSHPSIEAYIEAIGLMRSSQLPDDHRCQLPDGRLLFGSECKEVRLMSARDNERVAGTDGKRVAERGRVLGREAVGLARTQALAENAPHQREPTRHGPYPCHAKDIRGRPAQPTTSLTVMYPTPVP